MKTREEFAIAIDEMIFEAGRSGFSLIIGFGGGEKATLAATGNTLTCIGLADELYDRAKQRIIEAPK